MNVKEVLHTLHSINNDIEIYDITQSEAAYEGAIAQLHELIDRLETLAPMPDSSGDY